MYHGSIYLRIKRTQIRKEVDGQQIFVCLFGKKETKILFSAGLKFIAAVIQLLKNSLIHNTR